MIDDSDAASLPESSPSSLPALGFNDTEKGEKRDNKGKEGNITLHAVSVEETRVPLDIGVLRRAFRRAAVYSLGFTFIVTIVGEWHSLAFFYPVVLTSVAHCSAHPDVLLALHIQQTVLHVLGIGHNVRSIHFCSSIPHGSLLTSNRVISIWALISGAFCIILPIWESRAEIKRIVAGCFASLKTRKT